jgi:hypothetical protein
VWLAKYEDKYIRSMAAKNTNTPPEVLVQLAKDEDNIVRSMAAENPNIPAFVKLFY